MPGAIVVRSSGSPEVLEWTQVEQPDPGPQQVLLRHTAIGLNFIDVYHRTGLYPAPLPFTPGLEAAGVVEAVGSDVAGLKPGDRVAYAGNVPLGAYCETRVLPEDRVFPLPDGIGDEEAAAIMLKGCTVEYLVRRVYPVKAGSRVLLHAAAGGVGLLACQWLSALGAEVLGTVGSEEKARVASEHGCDHVILYRSEDVIDRVMSLTDGEGVDVVYDSVGPDTLEASLGSLRPMGMLVSFGNASGPVDPIAPLRLAKAGSLFLTRPRLTDYYAEGDAARDGVAALFEMVLSGRVGASVHQTFPLEAAAEAHRALESRRTVGASVLLV